jgi:hypothetical protein
MRRWLGAFSTLALTCCATPATRWHSALEGLRTTAYEHQCLLKRETPGPIVYFATEDQGRTQWLFCNGATVTQAEGGQPVYEESATAKKLKSSPEPQAYLDAAAAFGNVQHAPK